MVNIIDINLICFIEICLLSSAIAVISLTLTQTLIFKGFRKWVKFKNHFFGDLISCPYCASHWISVIFGIIFIPRAIITDNVIVDVIISIFLMIVLTTPWYKLMYWVYMANDHGSEYD